MALAVLRRLRLRTLRFGNPHFQEVPLFYPLLGHKVIRLLEATRGFLIIKQTVRISLTTGCQKGHGCLPNDSPPPRKKDAGLSKFMVPGVIMKTDPLCAPHTSC